MTSFIIICLYCNVVEQTCTPPPPFLFTNILQTVPVGINFSNFYLIKIIFCVMLLIRLLIYASAICCVVCEISTFQIEMIYIFIFINDPIDTSIIFFIFDRQLFHLKFTKCWLPQSTYYVSCVHAFIKIISFSSSLLCLGYLFPTWLTFIRIILPNDVETNPGESVNN